MMNNFKLIFPAPIELPKAFLDKWKEDLRSGKFKQTKEGRLCYDNADYEKTDTPDYSFCCIGVAGTQEYKEVHLLEEGWLGHKESDIIPPEINSDGDTELVKVLSSMNDHLSTSTYSLTLSKYGLNRSRTYNFNDIADFLDVNTIGI